MKVLDFIVCEDIRQELNGKLSLMGVYIDSMLINFHKEEVWPYVTRLSFFVKLDSEDAPAYPNCKFQVEREGVVRSSIPLQMDTKASQNKILTMMLNVQPFTISSPGDLKFSLEFSGSGLQTMKVELPVFKVRTGSVGAPVVKAQRTEDSIQ